AMRERKRRNGSRMPTRLSKVVEAPAATGGTAQETAASSLVVSRGISSSLLRAFEIQIAAARSTAAAAANRNRSDPSRNSTTSGAINRAKVHDLDHRVERRTGRVLEGVTDRIA